MTFRTRLFLTSLVAAAATLAVATALVSWSVRDSLNGQIERAITRETRLAAALLADRPAPSTPADVDREADRLGAELGVRVTFLAPDGTVIGDSDVAAGGLPALDNHLLRPEIQQALRDGLGVARRYSTTVDADMLYVASPVRNPDRPELALVRLAVPLTSVDEQLAEVRTIAGVAAGVGFVVALLLSWLVSALLSRRVSAIAAVAARYARGDLSGTARDYGSDEIGIVARALDAAVQETAHRLHELTSDRARMEAILTGMVEGVLVVDERGRVLLVNAAAHRLLRLQDPPEGRHYLETVRHPGVAAQVDAALRGDAADGVELALPMDPPVTYVSRSAPIRAPGATGAVLVLHDITDLRRADRIRRDFVANVSHELRTPLTAVRGYVEALLEDTGDEEQTRRFLEIIARHTLRMERLVQDLLRLARLDAGQEALDRVPCATGELFAGVEAELAPLLEPRRQTVVRRIAPDAASISGDPAKLHDALRNLLENASNYAPEGSTIELTAAREDDRIVVSVADEGPGIPEADLSRVFERFYRVDKARSRGGRDPGGTGLGLAIVKHLVELHGGTVRAGNREGAGAVFTISLPG